MMNNNQKTGTQLLFMFLIIFSSQGLHAAPAALTFQGRLVNNSVPVESPSVGLTVRVTSPSIPECILFEETHNLNMTNSDGIFTVKIGGGTRTTNDKSLSLTQVFSNTGIAISGLTCAGGSITSYTPGTDDTRHLYVTFYDGTDTVAFSSPYVIQSVPYALDTNRLQGKAANEFLQVTTNSTQTKLNDLMAPSVYNEVLSLVSGSSSLYMTTSNLGPTKLPVLSSSPTSPTAGQIWYEGGSLKYFDGASSTVKTVGTSAGGSVTSVVAGTGLTGGTITSSGTLALESGVIASPGTYNSVTVDTHGRVTAGSNPTTLSGYGIMDAVKVGGQTGALSLGTTDATTVSVLTQNIPRLTINSAGLVGINTVSPGTSFDLNGAATFRGMAAPNVSFANQGRLYFDSTSNTFKISQNGGVYADILTSASATGDITDVVAGAGFTGGATSGSATLDIGAGTGIVVNANDVAVDVGTTVGKIVQVQTGGKLPALDGSDLTNLDAGDIATGTLPIARGGTGQTTANGALNALLPSQAINAGKVLQTDGTNTSWVAGNAGTVTSVASANSYLSIATTTTTPVITANVGTTANTLAAGDDSRITGALQSSAYATDVADIASCTTSQTIYWNTVSDKFACQNINVSSAGGFFKDGGNSLGAVATLGTNDAYALNFETNNTTAMTIDNNGSVGIGTSTPASKLDVVGDISGQSLAVNSENISAIISTATTSISNSGFIANKLELFSNPIMNGATGQYTALDATSYYGSSNSNLGGLIGINASFSKSGTGTITNGYGLKVSTQVGAGNVTNSYGVHVGNIQGTNKWSFYASDATAKNYFAGNVGIGTTSPNTSLDIVAPSGTTGLSLKSGSTTDPYLKMVNTAGVTAVEFSSSSAAGQHPRLLMYDSAGTARVEMYTAAAAGPLVAVNGTGTSLADGVSVASGAGLFIRTPSGVGNENGIFFNDGGYSGSGAPGGAITFYDANAGAYGQGGLKFKTSNSPSGTQTRMTIDETGKVGIATTAPRATLDVAGTVLTKAATSNSTSTIDLSTGNMQYTTSSCGSFQFNNAKDGGTYMFVVQGSTSATCTFTAYSDAGSTALTVHMPPDNAATTASKHTIFNLAVLGTHVYVAWTPGY